MVIKLFCSCLETSQISITTQEILLRMCNTLFHNIRIIELRSPDEHCLTGNLNVYFLKTNKYIFYYK